MRVAPIEERRGEPGVQPYGFAVVADGRFVLIEGEVSVASVDIGRGKVGVRLDGLVDGFSVVGDGAFILLQLEVRVAAV